MGGEQSSKKDPFGMSIELIGENLTYFKNCISKPKLSNCIQRNWKFHYDKDVSVQEQINKYFNKLEQNKNNPDKTQNIKETLLVKIKNIFVLKLL